MKIKKAVIPAAGLGTRVLPASKSMPKEMLPIVDKPAIQYIVEEAVHSGIEDILIITSRGKTTVEDHFDRNPELEARLLASKKQEVYDEMVAISQMANIQYVRQKETKGLGHAVLCAKAFVGNEPFAVLYGDDVVLGGEHPACWELCRAYEQFGVGVAGIKPVPIEDISKYCSLAMEPVPGQERIFHLTDMVEKPSLTEVLSNYSILGRVVLPPEIFSILEQRFKLSLTDLLFLHQQGTAGMKDILVIENDLFCLGIAFVDDAFYLAVDLARHFLAVGSRMRQVAANKDLVVVSTVVDHAQFF